MKLDALKEWASRLRRKTYALYLAYRDPRVPWYAKLFAAVVVAYALSPIDLIPDFIPVLGYLDDLVLLPLGIALAVKMIPPHVMAECCVKAEKCLAQRKRHNWIAGAAVVAVWWALVGGLLALVLNRLLG